MFIGDLVTHSVCHWVCNAELSTPVTILTIDQKDEDTWHDPWPKKDKDKHKDKDKDTDKFKDKDTEYSLVI